MSDNLIDKLEEKYKELVEEYKLELKHFKRHYASNGYEHYRFQLYSRTHPALEYCTSDEVCISLNQSGKTLIPALTAKLHSVWKSVKNTDHLAPEVLLNTFMDYLASKKNRELEDRKGIFYRDDNNVFIVRFGGKTLISQTPAAQQQIQNRIDSIKAKGHTILNADYLKEIGYDV